MRKERILAHLFCLITMIVWGTTYISTKVLLSNFEPLVILVIRFALGYMLLSALSLKPIKYLGIKKEILFILSGFSGIVIYYLFENISLSYTSASNVSVIISTAPLFTLLFSSLFNKKRIKLIQVFSFISAMIGIVILEGNFEFNSAFLGDALALLAASSWGIYSVCIEKIEKEESDSIKCTRRVFFYGLLFMLPLLLFKKEPLDLFKFKELKNTLNLIYLGLVASALCFIFWNYSVSKIGAEEANAYIYLTPVVTVVFSAIILKEKLTIRSCIGLVIVISSLLFSSGLIKIKYEKKDNSASIESKKRKS